MVVPLLYNLYHAPCPGNPAKADTGVDTAQYERLQHWVDRKGLFTGDNLLILAAL